MTNSNRSLELFCQSCGEDLGKAERIDVLVDKDNIPRKGIYCHTDEGFCSLQGADSIRENGDGVKYSVKLMIYTRPQVVTAMINGYVVNYAKPDGTKEPSFLEGLHFKR